MIFENKIVEEKNNFFNNVEVILIKDNFYENLV